jgi:hypothetical protein
VTFAEAPALLGWHATTFVTVARTSLIARGAVSVGDSKPVRAKIASRQKTKRAEQVGGVVDMRSSRALGGSLEPGCTKEIVGRLPVR